MHSCCQYQLKVTLSAKFYLTTCIMLLALLLSYVVNSAPGVKNVIVFGPSITTELLKKKITSQVMLPIIGAPVYIPVGTWLLPFSWPWQLLAAPNHSL